MSNKGDFVLGNIEVHSTQNKGHDPEFWAAQATKKIVSISDDAPEHIKQQAVAFQNQVYDGNSSIFCLNSSGIVNSLVVL